MDTSTYPEKSLGYRLYGGSDPSPAPIRIPSDIALRSTSYGAREVHRLQPVHIVAAAIVIGVALVTLAYAIL